MQCVSTTIMKHTSYGSGGNCRVAKAQDPTNRGQGYMAQDHPACAKAIFSGAGFPDTTSEHDVAVILDSTSFYAEQGGQVNQLMQMIWGG